MVVVSGNTGSAPLIGSKVIQDRVYDGFVWSEKGPRIYDSMPNQTQTASEADRTSDGMKKSAFRITNKETHGWLNLWENLVDSRDLGKDFHDCPLEAQLKGFTNSLMIEKFTLRVPISRLVLLLSLAGIVYTIWY